MSPDRNIEKSYVSPEQQKADMDAYIVLLGEVLPQYARRARALTPDQPGSVEWTKAVGQFWQEARESRQLSRYGIAARVNTGVNNIRLLEAGFVELEQLDGFLEPYSQALGDPNLVEEYRQRFIVPPSTPPTAPK